VIQSVDRALQLLWLVRDTPGATLSDLSKRAGLLPSTAFRLLATLESHQLVTRVPGTKSYRLGPATRTLVEAGLDRLGVAVQVEAIVRRLALDTSERASFAVLDSGVAVHLVNFDGASEAGAEVIYAAPSAGRNDNLNSSAVGKVILAYSPKDVADSLIRHLPFKRTGRRTICSEDELRAEIARVRRAGYATSIDETNDHVRGIAAPVIDSTGGLVGAMSVHGPAYRFTRTALRRFMPFVLAAAQGASGRFGGAGERANDIR
jgi:DNA-binding IclR family transcriptional regulator